MSPNLPPSCREKRNDYTQINPGMKAITQAISNRSLGHPQPLNSLSEEMLIKRATRSVRGSYYKSITSVWGSNPGSKKAVLRSATQANQGTAMNWRRLTPYCASGPSNSDICTILHRLLVSAVCVASRPPFSSSPSAICSSRNWFTPPVTRFRTSVSTSGLK